MKFYKITIYLVLIFSFLASNINAAENAKLRVEAKEVLVSELVKRLKNRTKISPLLSDRIVFIYHYDSRCDGSTDGIVTTLLRARIDAPFQIKVTNDGDSWACDKNEESTFNIQFDLTKEISNWDRVERADYKTKDNIIYLLGRGESDYLVFHFIGVGGDLVINKIEYRSEDPG